MPVIFADWCLLADWSEILHEIDDPSIEAARKPELYKSGEKAWGAGQSKTIVSGNEDFLLQLSRARAVAVRTE